MFFHIIMGVCGCGKSTIGHKLGNELKIPFTDADDFHTSENKNKMNQGIPLTDEDRMPWLVAIHKHIKSTLSCGQQGIVACSSLKKKYREILLYGSSDKEMDKSMSKRVVFIYLKGPASVIRKRLTERNNHFMPANMLDSQLSILEEPGEDENHITVDIDATTSIDNILKEILTNLHF